ncbi:GrpB family protein [Nocardioides terrisoli]|uniref:GrpB family protein n=1 Tax=Nocardioides terrisoli TaxID=3388267 RepID=UPI00287BBF4F|nr:GrpB family protein [Nocardioides marmorisolisilvae]
MHEPHQTRVPRRDDVKEPELIGGVEKRTLVLVEHDPAWATRYREHERRIRAALGSAAIGSAAIGVEHIGSTAVPGLAAKPIIDILVTVPDITAEEDHLDPLVRAGYVLRVREPGHRMVRTAERDVHVHVLGTDDPAAADYLLLRDYLRGNAADRERYEATKRDLVARDWPDMNAYADAKTEVIEDIKRRARARLARREASTQGCGERCSRGVVKGSKGSSLASCRSRARWLSSTS